jgi:general nucleoside transport system ATP-binding protein
MPTPPQPILTVSGLSKIYGDVVANHDICAEFCSGHVHALLGENGAGKSTLVKIIYGLVRPDAGEMRLAGEVYRPGSPAEARARGVGLVFQHFSLFDGLDVAENIALGMSTPVSRRALSSAIRTVSQAYGLPLDPSRPVAHLSAGERQRVEIVRCLLQKPKVLIMDEPTSVLTPQEVELLFGTLRTLAKAGTAIIYISHKLAEIKALCDRATILRQGRVISTCDPAAVSVAGMAERMVGAVLATPRRVQAGGEGAVVLEVDRLSLTPTSPTGTALRAVSLRLSRGSILGIGGVAGNGQNELMEALSGERAVTDRTIRLAGRPIGRAGPRARRRLGLLTAPEERLGHAAAPGLSLTVNGVLTAADRERLQRFGFVVWSRARTFTERVLAAFDVRASSADAPAASLSGGNLQKFLIGREIMQRPEVLVVNQPTWGVDARAAAAIRQALMDLAGAGAAVLVISQDLDELLELSDTFAVLNGGALSAPCPTTGLTRERVGLMLGAAEDMQVADPRATARVDLVS